MLVKPLLADQRIIECLNSNYGIEADALTFLPLGADANAWVYKVNACELSYFLKLKLGHDHDVGIAIVELLAQAGISQIIVPIKTLAGELASRVDDYTVIVYPFIDGEDGFNRKLTDEQWVILGKVLKQIHQIQVPLTIQRDLRRETYSPVWRTAVRSLCASIESDVAGDEISHKLVKFMRQRLQIIHRLVDGAEQLTPRETAEFVLCHSDIHGGNVLIENNNLYVVDWDDPIMAPKERDLMFIGGGVGNVWNDPREERLFYQGYGDTEINMQLMAYYRHERIVEDIALYGQDLLLKTAGGANRAVMYDNFVAMFEQNGVVDMAFRIG
jgi:spectinomycin phosphotransferase